MPEIRVRWSEQEARKPYARPFMVAFDDDAGGSLGAVAVSGADLLYYRQFQAAVLALAGELFSLSPVDADPDPQRAWLDLIASLLPPLEALELHPTSTFDHERGRVFQVEAAIPGRTDPARLDGSAVLDYQELQAALAHQTGRLYRNPVVEAIADPAERHRAWLAVLAGSLSRPAEDEAMTTSWPWRPKSAP